jgi:hypothetical protein
LVVDSRVPVVAGLVGFLSVIPFELPVVPRSIEPDAFIPAPVTAGFSPGPGVPAGPLMLEPVPIEPARRRALGKREGAGQCEHASERDCPKFHDRFLIDMPRPLNITA